MLLALVYKYQYEVQLLHETSIQLVINCLEPFSDSHLNRANGP